MEQACLRPIPMSLAELRQEGVEQPDFVYISGDAYIDHPSFGVAIISRVLHNAGYSVGIIAQPDWKSAEAFRALGRPRLAYLVTAGNLDSMVNHYSAALHKRNTDAYTPDGVAGKRPDRAVIVYANRCREAYRGVPVIIGGIEASLRRFAHYDYWDNAVRHSILVDSGADILLYGMGEHSIVALADALSSGMDVKDITYIPGSCYCTATLDHVYEYALLPSYQEVSSNKQTYAKAFMQQNREQDAISGKRLVQQYEKGYLVANPPAIPLTQREMDEVYALPYTRLPHPCYKAHIPALDEVQFSLTSCRGCFGACSFCALTFHQGRVIQSRSHESLLAEARQMTASPAFKGYIHDVGGPTANFRKPACGKQLKSGACKNRQCIGYEKCQHLEVDHQDYAALLRKLRALPGVRKVFVRSGIRYDYVMYDKDDTFFRELIANHISGQLKVAPEHISDRVLYYMNKPSHALYERFAQKYTALNARQGKEQYLVPYLISSHPGSDLAAAIEMAEYLRDIGHHPEQVQDFYPTPGTLSTCMYYTGLDPRTMEPVFVPRTQKEKGFQRALLQWFLPRNFAKVREALRLADREDLIGYGKHALVPPEREQTVAIKRTKNNKPGKIVRANAERPGTDKSPKNKNTYARATDSKRTNRKTGGNGRHKNV